MEEVSKGQINLFRGAIVASVIMIFLAIPSDLWPYGYYVLLRWVVAGTGIFAAYIAYNLEKTFWVVPLAIVVLVFNPLVPVHLEKEAWVIIDFIAAVFLLSTLFVIKLPKGNNS